MQAPRQWFTCTPVHFKGDHTFFARDSGLLCKGFQEIGVDCKAIMPGTAMPSDHSEDLIRTDYRNLEDPDWWRSLSGEGVVFYGWGSGKYVKIVKAIKEAGLFLVTHMDTAGMLGILNGLSEYAGTLWRLSIGEQENKLLGTTRFAARLAYASSIGLLKNDISRSRHLKQADIIGAITPVAFERIRKVCRIYGGESLAGKVQLLPHPNASYMTHDPSVPKERLIVAVGRWDDAKVKGTDLLLSMTTQLIESDPHLNIEIYGRTIPSMESWHANLANGFRARVHLMGVVPNTELMRGFRRGRIILCTSLRESYNIAVAEALCCGCSVVGPDVPEIPSMKWFATGDYGRMADRTADSLAHALLEEMIAWDENERNPAAISKHWTSLLHAPQVATRILEMAGFQEQRQENHP